MKRQNKKPHKRTSARKSRPTGLRRAVQFLPAFLISLFATLLWTQPQFAAVYGGPGVLAKATNTSVTGLLNATNAQRGANGVGSLALNSKLNAAAQAKANDMVTRGYWAHVSPDGKQPWWFIANAGYQYTSAGENLAYGFGTSDSTITGWMNSPSHRTNMLNGTFTEVGFGITDTDDYIYDGASHGPQTIVVAMYAKPQAAAPAPAPASPPATQPAATQKTQASAKPAESTPEAPVAETAPAPEEPTEATTAEQAAEEPIAVADTEQTITAAPTKVSRVQLLTGGAAIWSASFVLLAVCAAAGLWFMHKGLHIKRYILAGEKFLAHHHIHLDLTILSIIYLGFVLLAASGTIR